MKEDVTSCIYALVDPESLEIRYVGKTSRSLTRRTRKHWSSAKSPKYYSQYWIRSVLERGKHLSIKLR